MAPPEKSSKTIFNFIILHYLWTFSYLLYNYHELKTCLVGQMLQQHVSRISKWGGREEIWYTQQKNNKKKQQQPFLVTRTVSWRDTSDTKCCYYIIQYIFKWNFGWKGQNVIWWHLSPSRLAPQFVRNAWMWRSTRTAHVHTNRWRNIHPISSWVGIKE